MRIIVSIEQLQKSIQQMYDDSILSQMGPQEAEKQMEDAIIHNLFTLLQQEDEKEIIIQEKENNSEQE